MSIHRFKAWLVISAVVLPLLGCGGSGETSGTGGASGGSGGKGGTASGGAGGSGGSCAPSGTSCANGESCCPGLTCCSGNPIPPGQESCGVECPVSDRNLKQNFQSVDPNQVLEQLAKVPISTWSYKTDNPSVRHIGPMAQDFKATFGVGASDRTIFQIDGDGVALAAIQGLRARLLRLEAENEQLKRTVKALESRSGRPVSTSAATR